MFKSSSVSGLQNHNFLTSTYLGIFKFPTGKYSICNENILKRKKKRKSRNQNNLLSCLATGSNYGLATGQKPRNWREPYNSVLANALILPLGQI